MWDAWRRWRRYRRMYLLLISDHIDAGYRLHPETDEHYRAEARRLTEQSRG